MQRELKLRIVSAIILAILVLGAAWAGGTIFALVSVLIGLLVFFEWTTITRMAAADLQGTALAWAGLVVLCGLVLTADVDVTLPVLAGLTVLAIVWCLARRTSLWLAGGVLYAGLTAISLAALRGTGMMGLVAILFLFAVVWATDIFAFFIGRAIGGPKLAPRISPGKTWSGAIGGALCGMAAGTGVVAASFSLTDLRIPLLAFVLSVSSQLGDLLESYIKRRFGVKDSGRLIPGHGGIMDRVDGLVFACFAALALALVHVVLSTGETRALGAVLLGL